MKKSIILLSSILLFWACKENVESTPACNPKSIPALKQHMVGKWNIVGWQDVSIGYKTTMEFKNNGTFQAPIEVSDNSFISDEREMIHEINIWEISKADPKTLIMEGYEKGSNNRFGSYERRAENILCDRVDFGGPGNRLSFYKDNYRIPAICGADTSKGNIENWLVGKWNYVITPNFGDPNTIRTPKGVIEFKNDFTLTDSNPYGFADVFEYNEIDKIKPTYMWMSVNDVEPLYFVILANNTKSKYYRALPSGFCQATNITCNKITFLSPSESYEITLTRIR